MRGSDVKNEITRYSPGVLFLFPTAFSLLISRQSGILTGYTPNFTYNFGIWKGQNRTADDTQEDTFLFNSLTRESLFHRYRVPRDGNSCLLFVSRFEDFAIDDEDFFYLGAFSSLLLFSVAYSGDTFGMEYAFMQSAHIPP